MLWLFHLGFFSSLPVLAVGAATNLVQNSSSESQQSQGQKAYLEGKVVVFGDSFSDNGTGAWTVSNHTWPADPAYFGHRFSNGPVWVEVLANRLNMELVDSAIGGATSNNSVAQGLTGRGFKIHVPSVLDQVAAYLERNEVGPRDLFIIVIGGNDAIANATIKGVVPAVSNIVYRLHERGATKFLLASYPSLEHLPLRSFSSPSTISTLTHLSLTLRLSLMDLRYRLCHGSHIQVGFVDTWTLVQDMTDNPQIYGFDPSHIGESCLVGAYGETKARKLCDDPDKYIFWDEYHPTRVVHRHVGALAWSASQVLCNGEDQNY